MTAETGRRRQRLGAEERREQLVAAAVAVVAGHGYRAATADAIARHADVSKGLLWHYFADLDYLRVVAARGTLVALRAAVAADVDLSAPAPRLRASPTRPTGSSTSGPTTMTRTRARPTP